MPLHAWNAPASVKGAGTFAARRIAAQTQIHARSTGCQSPAAFGVALGAASSPARIALRSMPTLGEGSFGSEPGLGASSGSYPLEDTAPEFEPKLVVADVPISLDRARASTFELLIVESPWVALSCVASGEASLPDWMLLPIDVEELLPAVCAPAWPAIVTPRATVATATIRDVCFNMMMPPTMRSSGLVWLAPQSKAG
ncbi:hypothetical protein [Jiella mangrovi]|uniref:Uncharacterized protein n=1 Tax=Jiella mangrovi TaxID=2821407 RepID=A0ABS4BDB0_9HYPH|nr:hypothetical protein [Jiella mangrovi]MBP0614059.1 hypothetical protein [Jiella mangrovi]